MTIHSEDYNYCEKCSSEYIDKCDCREQELAATIKELNEWYEEEHDKRVELEKKLAEAMTRLQTQSEFHKFEKFELEKTLTELNEWKIIAVEHNKSRRELEANLQVAVDALEKIEPVWHEYLDCRSSEAEIAHEALEKIKAQ